MGRAQKLSFHLRSDFKNLNIVFFLVGGGGGCFFFFVGGGGGGFFSEDKDEEELISHKCRGLNQTLDALLTTLDIQAQAARSLSSNSGSSSEVVFPFLVISASF